MHRGFGHGFVEVTGAGFHACDMADFHRMDLQGRVITRIERKSQFIAMEDVSKLAAVKELIDVRKVPIRAGNIFRRARLNKFRRRPCFIISRRRPWRARRRR